MRNFLVAIITLIFMFGTANTVSATDFSNVSDNAKITSALNMLEKTNSKETIDAVMGQNSANKQVKIMFFSLGSVSPEYANAHAMATSDDNGVPYILINEKHRNAPAEAIACLIVHEMTHQLSKTTMDEEVQAWSNEVSQWAKFKAMNPSMNFKGELVDRLNNLYANSSKSDSYISMAVANNSNYSQLK